MTKDDSVRYGGGRFRPIWWRALPSGMVEGGLVLSSERQEPMRQGRKTPDTGRRYAGQKDALDMELDFGVWGGPRGFCFLLFMGWFGISLTLLISRVNIHGDWATDSSLLWFSRYQEEL